MFRGFDRAKYDLKDPSAWTALQLDRALHAQALATVELHLKSTQSTAQATKSSAPVTQLGLRGTTQRAGQLPESVRSFATQTTAQAQTSTALKTEKKFWPHS